MFGVPVSFLQPRLLSLGKVGRSLGYLLGVSRVGPQYPPSLRPKGSPDDIISKGKPEDSSKETGATGSSPLGKAPVKRRVRTKGSVPPGGVPKVAVPPAAPEDDPDLQDIDPSLPEDTEEFPRGAPEVSSLEPRRIALPLPGQEVSRATHVRKAEQRC